MFNDACLISSDLLHSCTMSVYDLTTLTYTRVSNHKSGSMISVNQSTLLFLSRPTLALETIPKIGSVLENVHVNTNGYKLCNYAIKSVEVSLLQWVLIIF